MINEDYILAVKRGAYWMDENHPDWAQRIELDCFQMDDCQECIVGQAIGDYGTSIAKASGSHSWSKVGNDWAVEHGFDVPMKAYEDDAEYEAYLDLETLWTEQVRDRLGGEGYEENQS